MLDDRRKHYVTASAAHRVMSGFQSELQNAGIENPNNPELMRLVTRYGKLKVGEAKAQGVIASGSEIAEMHKYVKSLEPPITEGMKTVAREIAISEFIKTQPDNFTSSAMEMGNELEGDAVSILAARVARKIENTGDNQSFFHTENLSATPDGVIYDGFDVIELAEVKCLQIAAHSKFLHLVKDQNDLLEHAPEYYWQTQTQLEVTGANMVHFQTYCPYMIDDYNLVYVEVLPNKQHIDILKSRAETVLNLVPEIRQNIIDNPARELNQTEEAA